MNCARMSPNFVFQKTQVRKKLVQKLSGTLFNVLEAKKELLHPHPLDTNRSEYLEVIKTEVIPACQSIVPKNNKIHSRIGDMLVHVNPAFDVAWNFAVELTYKVIAPEKDRTEDNMRLMRILRAIADLNFSWTAIIDDITDSSEVRRGKPTWHTFCDGGVKAANYDTIFMSSAGLHLATRFFRDRHGYAFLLESLAKSISNVAIGQTMDYLGQRTDGQDDYESIVTFKAGNFTRIAPTLAMIHAGILDRKVIEQMEDIWHHFGVMLQAWDDFTDAYSEPKLTGKPCNLDASNANTTWVSTTAYKHFNETQKQAFMEVYGSKDPVKIQRLRRLYEEINLPYLYIRYLQGQWNHCSSLIDKLPDYKLKEAATSYMNWLIGGVENA